MKQWVAHVGLQSGGIAEVTVWATDRWDASSKVYSELGMTGANDPKMTSYKLEEVEDEGVVVPDIPVRDKQQDKRYRVRMYASPASKALIKRIVQTSSPQQALWSIMSMHKVLEEGKLGPYIVEEDLSFRTNKAEEWVTMKYNQIHTFPQRGPLSSERAKDVISDDYSPAPRQTVIDQQSLDEEWDAAMAERLHGGYWPGMDGTYYEQLREQRIRRVYSPPQTFIKEVKDIFKDEKKAPLPNYTVVKR